MSRPIFDLYEIMTVRVRVSHISVFPSKLQNGECQQNIFDLQYRASALFRQVFEGRAPLLAITFWTLHKMCLQSYLKNFTKIQNQSGCGPSASKSATTLNFFPALSS